MRMPIPRRRRSWWILLVREIYVDGTALSNYPATELLDYGAHDVQAVGLDQWHVFTGLSSTGPQVAPSMANAAGSISVTEPATYTAHFNVIEHSDRRSGWRYRTKVLSASKAVRSLSRTNGRWFRNRSVERGWHR